MSLPVQVSVICTVLCLYTLQCTELETEINLRDGEAISAAAEEILLANRMQFSLETGLHLSNLTSLVRQHATWRDFNQSWIGLIESQ